MTGEDLRRLRYDIQLTQKEFAALLQLSVGHLGRMENNIRPISLGLELRIRSRVKAYQRENREKIKFT